MTLPGRPTAAVRSNSVGFPVKLTGCSQLVARWFRASTAHEGGAGGRLSQGGGVIMECQGLQLWKDGKKLSVLKCFWPQRKHRVCEMIFLTVK